MITRASLADSYSGPVRLALSSSIIMAVVSALLLDGGQAVRLTAAALLRGFGHDFLLTDEDLNPIRDNEQFRKLAEGVKVMKDLGGKK